MARKYDFISELYNRTCKTVVANPASWEAFLRSACYNYRLRIDEQLYGCEELPAGQPVLCDVLLADAAGTQRVLPYPDEALTAQNIQEGDTVALLPDGTLKKLRCI